MPSKAALLLSADSKLVLFCQCGSKDDLTSFSVIEMADPLRPTPVSVCGIV
jgi:hypothetical protein